MAKRPNLSQITSSVFTVSQLNTAYDKIDTAFDNTLSRDGSTPNTMLADLDMNSNDILNAGTLYGTTLDVTEAYIGGKLFTGTTPAAWGAVSLAELGYNPADGDVRDMITAALALSRSKEVIIPYNASPWISLGTLTIGEDTTIRFEAGAVIDQQHDVSPGILLSGDRAKLMNATITSTTRAYQTLASVTATAAATNSHRRREIRVTGADCEIVNLDIEYAAQGITISGARCKVRGLTTRYLRSQEGWAAAVNVRPGGDGSVIEINMISDCDRAMEPEDGVAHVRFLGRPGTLERIESRWFDCTATQSETFVISAHSHSGAENYLPTTDVTFDDFTVIDCPSAVLFTKSSGSDAQMPRDCHVRNLRIVGYAASQLSSPPPVVSIEANNCSVEFTTEGATGSLKRALINRGEGNRVRIKDDPVMQVPWVSVASTATGSSVDVDVGTLTTQPTASGASHMVETTGPRTEIRVRLSGVQNVGYVLMNGGADGSVVRDCQITAPASAAGSQMVRFNGCDNCLMTGSVFRDDAGVMVVGRFVANSDRNFVTGCTVRKASGNLFQIDSGATGNVIVGNSLNGGTIANSGTSSTVTPNY